MISVQVLFLARVLSVAATVTNARAVSRFVVRSPDRHTGKLTAKNGNTRQRNAAVHKLKCRLKPRCERHKGVH